MSCINFELTKFSNNDLFNCNQIYKWHLVIPCFSSYSWQEFLIQFMHNLIIFVQISFPVNNNDPFCPFRRVLSGSTPSAYVIVPIYLCFLLDETQKLTKHGPKSNTLYKWNKDEKWRSFLISQQVILNKATAALLAKKNVKGLVTRQFFMKFWSSLLYSIII